MTEQSKRRYRRPRLGPDAHARLMEEIAKFDVPPVSVQIAETMRGLRDDIVPPIEEDDALAALPDAVPSEPEQATATPKPEIISQAVAQTIADSTAPEAPPQDAPQPEPKAAPDERPAPRPDRRRDQGAIERSTTAGPNAPADAQAAIDTAMDDAPADLPARVDAWEDLRRLPIDPEHLDRNLIITAGRTDPAHASFDVMRTRLVQAMAEKGWKRVAITSPTKGCGKSFTAANLAITLSRYENHRTILMDMDLRHPALARYLGVGDAGSMGDVLRGETSLADHLRRPGDNTLNIGRKLAIGLNGRPENFAAELFQQPSTDTVLRAMEEDFAPDVVLFDLPPALAYDDVIAFRPQFDCVLLVVGGGITTAKEVTEVHRRLGEDKPVLGVILNMAEDEEDNTY